MPKDYIKTFPQYVLPKHSLTTLAGILAEISHPRIKNYLIRRFIRRFKVNMQEALKEHPEEYRNFNEFFIRRLKPESRPLACSDIVSPVDGFVSEIGSIQEGQLLQAKNKFYSVAELLGRTPEECEQFNHGAFATLYLSPRDYHRVHMPMDGTLLKMTYIPGKLFSVQPTTARVIPKLFAINERLVIYFNTDIGTMVMVLVGATIVGGIGTSWHGNVIRGSRQLEFNYSHQQASMKTVLHKAEEMGYFKLGSTVVLLFAQGHKMAWEKHLQAGSPIKFGGALGGIT
jgi:phosphatidylserine decarboxylase